MHNVGYVIFSEEKKNFLCKDPGIGPMSAPGYPYESQLPSNGIWTSEKEAVDYLQSWTGYSSYTVKSLAVL